jgi:hypothetical protein
VTIGASESDPLGQLNRVVGAIWLGAAGLLIANGGPELRVYDFRGRHVATGGRRGEGPGEFADIYWLGRGGDSTVFVYDRTQRRLSEFSARGQFVQSHSLSRPDLGDLPLVEGYLGGREVLALFPVNGGPRPTTTMVLPQPYRAFAFDIETREARLLRSAPGPETFFYYVEGRGYAMSRPAFGPLPKWSARNGRVFYSEGLAYAFHVLDPSGRVLTEGGQPERVVRITSSMRDSVVAERLKTLTNPANGPRIEAELRASMSFHENLPLVQEMRVDELGNVWLRGRDNTRWDVFSSTTGVQVASIVLPSHQSILDIANGAVVLHQTAASGVEVVRVYPLNRGP